MPSSVSFLFPGNVVAFQTDISIGFLGHPHFSPLHFLMGGLLFSLQRIPFARRRIPFSFPLSRPPPFPNVVRLPDRREFVIQSRSPFWPSRPPRLSPGPLPLSRTGFRPSRQGAARFRWFHDPCALSYFSPAGPSLAAADGPFFWRMGSSLFLAVPSGGLLLPPRRSCGLRTPAISRSAGGSFHVFHRLPSDDGFFSLPLPSAPFPGLSSLRAHPVFPSSGFPPRP